MKEEVEILLKHIQVKCTLSALIIDNLAIWFVPGVLNDARESKIF